MTTSPRSSAGRTTSRTKAARAPSIRKSSVSAGTSRSRASSRTLRMASPTGVPPGSRAATQGMPAAVSHAPSRRTCVDLPAPSTPSRTMNRLMSGAKEWRGGRNQKRGRATFRPPAPSHYGRSVVVVEAEVRDLVLAHHPAKRVLELPVLDEDVVLRVQPGLCLRRLEVEGQPLLDPAHPAPGREVEEERQIEHDRSREDRVPAEEVDLDLHRIAEPSEDVDVVPALLVVSTRRVVVDPHLVVEVLVQLGVHLRLQDVIERTELRLLLRLEGCRVVQNLAVAVPQDVRREPPVDPEHPGLEPRRQDGLHQGLARLEVLSGDRHAALLGELLESRDVGRQV